MNDKTEMPSADAQDQEAETLLGLENLDDVNMDEIEDAPGFVVPPEGAYRLELSKATYETYKTKEEPNKPKRRIAHYYVVRGVKELVDSTEKVPSEGSMFSERWQLTADGLKYWKQRAISLLADDVKGMTVGQVMQALNDKGIIFDAKISHRKTENKKDGKEYTNLNIRVTSVSSDLPDDALGGGV